MKAMAMISFERFCRRNMYRTDWVSSASADGK